MDEPARIPLWLASDDGGAMAPAVVFTPRYAGFWRRFVAATVDWIILWLVSWVVFFALKDVPLIAVEEDAFLESPWRAIGVSLATTFAVSFAIGWVYCAGFESSPWRGTPGKRLLGVVVTDLAGDRLSVSRASGRFLAESLSSALFLVGYLVQPFTERRQALHDVLAGTVVVRLEGAR